MRTCTQSIDKTQICVQVHTCTREHKHTQHGRVEVPRNIYVYVLLACMLVLCSLQSCHQALQVWLMITDDAVVDAQARINNSECG